MGLHNEQLVKKELPSRVLLYVSVTVTGVTVRQCYRGGYAHHGTEAGMHTMVPRRVVHSDAPRRVVHSDAPRRVCTSLLCTEAGMYVTVVHRGG